MNDRQFDPLTGKKSGTIQAAAGQTGNSNRVLADNRKTTAVLKTTNNTGLPHELKSGVENISGISMDDVKVHYNSSQPAQLNAHAYAQGTDIHLTPGQEKHLPHEAWHVVQQKQGRVKPTMQLKGKVNINDDKGLEREADAMGSKALQMQQAVNQGQAADYKMMNKKPTRESSASSIQRSIRVEGDKATQEYYAGSLDELLAGSGATVHFDRYGRISLVNSPAAHSVQANHAGYRLLSRMIQSHNLVSIGIDQRHPGDGPYAREDSERHAANPMRGSGAFIHFNRNYRSVDTTRDAFGNLNVLTVPRSLVLGHELIHADHMQRGRLLLKGQTATHQVQGNISNYGAVNYQEREEHEELSTVGLVPKNRPADITENELRGAIGIDPRVSYNRVESTLTENHVQNRDNFRQQAAALNPQIQYYLAAHGNAQTAANHAQFNFNQAVQKNQYHLQRYQYHSQQYNNHNTEQTRNLLQFHDNEGRTNNQQAALHRQFAQDLRNKIQGHYNKAHTHSQAYHLSHYQANQFQQQVQHHSAQANMHAQQLAPLRAQQQQHLQNAQQHHQAAVMLQQRLPDYKRRNI